jgi:hypothetical protein
MKSLILHIVIGTVFLCLTACSEEARTSFARSGNSVYYWQTTFVLDSVEQAFLKHHDIRTVYCRYFDVVMGDAASDMPMPNATIQFLQPVPDSLEIVPTVFIMNNCMQRGVNTDSLARLIVRRIVQMNETNDIANVHEIQIDCDYTLRNRELYYHFLEQVRQEARNRQLALSATIRLHQLSMPEPPVDYGVLMLYNTGSLEKYEGEGSRNPILDLRDVQPYLRYLRDYRLPLGAAYPVFLWQRELYGVSISHVADYEEVVRTKQAVEREREDLRRLILTYHLAHENIDRYTSKQYEAIYKH